MKIEHTKDKITIDGEKVKYAHFRYLDPETGMIAPRGGATVAYIGEKGEVKAAGIAYCSPEDNFQYAYGRHKAAGRLVQGLKNGQPGDDPLNEAKVATFLLTWTAEEVRALMDAYGLDQL